MASFVEWTTATRVRRHLWSSFIFAQPGLWAISTSHTLRRAFVWTPVVSLLIGSKKEKAANCVQFQCGGHVPRADTAQGEEPAFRRHRLTVARGSKKPDIRESRGIDNRRPGSIVIARSRRSHGAPSLNRHRAGRNPRTSSRCQTRSRAELGRGIERGDRVALGERGSNWRRSSSR